MKRKIIALLLCIVCVVSLCFPVAADDDGYSAIVSDIDKTCPTCGATLHASWGSTSGAEVELEISDTGKVKIPAGAGAFARIHLRCSSCGYEKTETRLLGLDFGAEKPGKLVQAPPALAAKTFPAITTTTVRQLLVQMVFRRSPLKCCSTVFLPLSAVVTYMVRHLLHFQMVPILFRQLII